MAFLRLFSFLWLFSWLFFLSWVTGRLGFAAPMRHDVLYKTYYYVYTAVQLMV